MLSSMIFCANLQFCVQLCTGNLNVQAFVIEFPNRGSEDTENVNVQACVVEMCNCANMCKHVR